MGWEACRVVGKASQAGVENLFDLSKPDRTIGSVFTTAFVFLPTEG